MVTSSVTASGYQLAGELIANEREGEAVLDQMNNMLSDGSLTVTKKVM